MNIKIKRWLYEKDFFEYKPLRKFIKGKYIFVEFNNKVTMWIPSEFICNHMSTYEILDMEEYGYPYEHFEK